MVIYLGRQHQPRGGDNNSLRPECFPSKLTKGCIGVQIDAF